jgi:hypothetical protein
MLQCRLLKILVFLEKHCKTDDSAVDEQAADNGHDHGRCGDESRVAEQYGEGCNVSR